MPKKNTVIEPRKINNLKQAKRLLADYLYHYQTKDINENQLKTVIYGCIKYAEICKIEAQIKNPEIQPQPITVNVRNN